MFSFCRKLLIGFDISHGMETVTITIIIVIFLVAGFLIGTVSSIAGIGGGAFYILTIMLLIAAPIDNARDTSAFIILLFSGMGFLSYLRQGKINVKISLIFTGFALLGSITASIYFIIFPIDNTILKIVIASVILVSGLNMVRKALRSLNIAKLNDNKIENVFNFETLKDKTNLLKGSPLFFIAGFVAYLSGIGGGMLFVPILNIFYGIPIHYATAVSTSIIFFIAIYNATARMFIGEIVYLAGILIGSGAIFGAIFGSKVSNKFPKRYLQFFVAAILMGLAIRMYFMV